MKDTMSEFEFYALYTGKGELCYLAQTLCLFGGSQIWWSLKKVKCLCGVRKKMYQIKKTLPSHP